MFAKAIQGQQLLIRIVQNQQIMVVMYGEPLLHIKVHVGNSITGTVTKDSSLIALI